LPGVITRIITHSASIFKMAKRFASHTDDKILQQRLKSILTTTERANKRAANLLW
jgi:hypothetical protein